MKPEELNLATIAVHFATPDKAREFIEGMLWPQGPVCPHCKSQRATRMVSKEGTKHPVRPGLVKCKDCRKKYSVTVGTIFEDSHIPLNKWLMAIFLMCGAKKSLSAHQLHRSLGVTYKSAWFMAHRIRYALKDPVFAGKMSGTVEVDECYFGPKGTAEKPRAKSAVVALVNRETGERRSVVLERITAKDLKQAVAEHVAVGATVNTDESVLYRKIPAAYRHKTNCHTPTKGKPRYHYIDKQTGETVTTNYAESSFSLLRRGVIGSFHHISRKHLGLYVGEFDFRWNHRKTTDGERVAAGMLKVVGKRLTLKPLKAMQVPTEPKRAPRAPRAKNDPIIPPPPKWWTDKQP
jgi:transposase-like protein